MMKTIMNETPKNQLGRRMQRALFIWLTLFVVIELSILFFTLAKHYQHLFWEHILLTGVVGASAPFCFWYFACWSCNRRNLGRLLIGSAVFATLAAIFYLEEDWRGKRAWEKCKAELEAKGAVLDWDKFIPLPVPKDQNFFMASTNMQKWFVRVPYRTPPNELSGLSTNGQTTATITNVSTAADFLKWSDQFRPQFDQIREALKRPYARMDGDYSIPYEIPIPNFIQVRVLAQTLAQRAKCHLLLGQPEKALDDLTLLHNLCRMLEGKPVILVSAMINVAVTGLYVDTVAEGFRLHAWQESQMAALQEQLNDINLPPQVVNAFRWELAATTHTLETAPATKLSDIFSGRQNDWRWALWPQVKSALIPRGWIYQNMATDAKLGFQQTAGFNSENDIIQPKKFPNLARELERIPRPYKFIAAVGFPNFTKAWQTTARNQTEVFEAQIVCALERYRLVHGEYPDALDSLTPQFIEQLPHDIIGGKPLHYRRTPDGKFLFYSIGWNETDDGGASVAGDLTKGDWVWKN